MKEQQLPWYVRLDNYLRGTKCVKPIKIVIASIIFAAICTAIVSYIVIRATPVLPYEEAYDIQFVTFVNSKMEDISVTVIDESTGINHKKLSGMVLEYEIEYTEQGIQFSYLLDNNKVISEYYSTTGKIPAESVSEKEMQMDIQISSDFQIISKTSFWDTLPTCEEYELSHSVLINVLEAAIRGAQCLLILMLVLALLGTLLFALLLVLDKWKKVRNLS